jgi:hypothetical protein
VIVFPNGGSKILEQMYEPQIGVDKYNFVNCVQLCQMIHHHLISLPHVTPRQVAADGYDTE